MHNHNISVTTTVSSTHAGCIYSVLSRIGGGGGSLSITVNDCNTTYVCRFDVCREQEWGGGGVITKYCKGADKRTFV